MLHPLEQGIILHRDRLKASMRSGGETVRPKRIGAVTGKRSRARPCFRAPIDAAFEVATHNGGDPRQFVRGFVTVEKRVGATTFAPTGRCE